MNVIDRIPHYFDGSVGLSVFYVLGSPEAGKTVFAKTLINKIKNMVGRENLHYVLTRKVKDCYHELNPDKKYQLFLIEDAIKEQSGRTSMDPEQVKMYQNLPEVRHIAEEIRGLPEGRIIVIVNSQLPKGVDLVVRNMARATFIKDLNLQEEQHQTLLKNIGLSEWDISREIKPWINKVNCQVVKGGLDTVLMVKKSGEYNWIRGFEPKDGVEPDINKYYIEMAGSEDSSSEASGPLPASSEDMDAERIDQLLDETLEEMKRESKWETKAEVLDLSLQGYNNLEIPEKTDAPEGSISYYKKAAMGELKNRMGHKYELIVGERLKEKGFEDVEPQGGTGEPDIIAKNEDGDLVAVSVKIFDYGRQRHSLQKEELRPELQFKENNEGSKALLWYTNLAWGDSKAGVTYFEEIPEKMDRVVITEKDGLVQ